MTFDQDKTTGILRIAGHLRIDEVGPLKSALCQYVLNEPKLDLDLSAVDSCDAAGLQLLLAAEKTAAHLGKPYSLQSVSDAVTQSAAALGLTLVAKGDSSK
jgi:anti-anti-sigma regulatory factor